MADILAPVLIGVASGLSAGALSAYITPVSAWSVEKRRDRTAARRELVAKWRSGVNQFFADRSANVSVPDADVQELHRLDWYQTLRDHVKPEVVTGWEKQPPRDPKRPNAQTIQITMGAVIHPTMRSMLTEVARLEREWKLI